MTDCEDFVRPVLRSAFEEDTSITEVDGECRVTIPFERPDGDAITLWVRPDGEKYVVSDEGETYGYLYLSNVNLDRARRARRIRRIEERFGLDSAKHEISLTASRERLGSRLLDAIQAVQSIAYLAYTRRQYTQTEFADEVRGFLDDAGYRYERNVDVAGESEPHRVDFHLGNGAPTYLDALHAEDASTARTIAERTAFKWVDITARTPDATTVVVLDDEAGEYDERTTRILRNYSDALVPWSARDSLRGVLG